MCPYLINTDMFKGTKTKIGAILPILDKNWVAKRVILALMQNEETLIIPFWCNFGFAAKGLLPAWFYDYSMIFMGIDSLMDGFEGNNK